MIMDFFLTQRSKFCDREEIFHSVRLDEEKCKGCTHCIRHCPTEAIRVKEGKLELMKRDVLIVENAFGFALTMLNTLNLIL